MRVCLWTFLLACFVLLAPPFQGVAQAAMPDCHGQMEQPVAQMPTVAVEQVHTAGKPDKCNACSPCCAGVLLNSVQMLAVATLTTGSNFHYPASTSPAPTLAGLERPPRLLAL